MKNKEQREHEFRKKLAEEVAGNVDDIADVLSKSEVGKCGGKCKGFAESDLKDLCPECLQALESVSDEIFSVSPELRRLGDVMNSRD